MITPNNPATAEELAAAQTRIAELEKSNSKLAGDAAELAALKDAERPILKLMGKGLTKEQAIATIKRKPIFDAAMKVCVKTMIDPVRAKRQARQDVLDKLP